MATIDAEFLASFWTLSGPSHPLTCNGINLVPLEGRVAAAAEAGYVGFAFIDTDLAAIRQTKSWQEIARILRDSGLAFVEIELITNWFATGDLKSQSDAVRDLLFEAAQELGADHVKVVGDFGNDVPVPEMTDSFADLCLRAEKAGTKIAIELTPLTNLYAIDDGLRLIRDSGAGNAGLLLDVWHIGRAGIPYEEISKIPGHLIYGVELDDADLQVRGTLMEDTMRHRRLPGEGDLEPARLIAQVHKAGYRLPYGVEIVSDAHRELPVREQARVAIESSRRQMKEAEKLL